MRLLPKKTFFLFLVFPVFLKAQDSLRYRSTIFDLSASHFLMLAPKYPSASGFAPSVALSLKSIRTDSMYAPLHEFNFMITTGVAYSRYWFSDDYYFKNFLNKDPMLIFSKRFFGGFGINYRKKLSDKFILDLDVAPIVEIIVDKSEETRTDTSSWESKGFEDIYEGLHLYVNVKLEYRTKSNFAFFFTLSGSVPLLNGFVDNGDDKYHNLFKGQFFAGIGMAYFYKSKRRIEPPAKVSQK